MHSGGAGPRLPAPGIRTCTTSTRTDAVHRQARPGTAGRCTGLPERRTSASPPASGGAYVSGARIETSEISTDFSPGGSLVIQTRK